VYTTDVKTPFTTPLAACLSDGALFRNGPRVPGYPVERGPIKLDGDTLAKHRDRNNQPHRGLLPQDAPPVTPERTLRDGHEISLDERGIGHQASAGFLEASELAQLGMEKVLIPDLEKPDDETAPKRGGPRGGSSPQKYVPRKQRDERDESAAGASRMPLVLREIERHAEGLEVADERLFLAAPRMRNHPREIGRRQVEEALRKNLRASAQQRHVPVPSAANYSYLAVVTRLFCLNGQYNTRLFGRSGARTAGRRRVRDGP
jgi:hypothetical protein